MHNTLVLQGGSGRLLELDFEPFNMLPPPVSVVNNLFQNRAATPTSTQSAFCARKQVQNADYNLYDNFLATPCAAGATTLVTGQNSLTGSAGIDPVTLKLLGGSPAIDRGFPLSAPSIDFEGQTRPRGSAHDIGADEF